MKKITIEQYQVAIVLKEQQFTFVEFDSYFFLMVNMLLANSRMDHVMFLGMEVKPNLRNGFGKL